MQRRLISHQTAVHESLAKKCLRVTLPGYRLMTTVRRRCDRDKLFGIDPFNDLNHLWWHADFFKILE
jgi:hypothetical protein